MLDDQMSCTKDPRSMGDPSSISCRACSRLTGYAGGVVCHLRMHRLSPVFWTSWERRLSVSGAVIAELSSSPLY